MSGRPRRTRIYGANYNIGESYYKPTLDNLDRKHFGSPVRESLLPSLDSIHREIDSEFKLPKSSFRKALTEEPSFLDLRDKLPSLNSAALLDDDLDDDVQATLRKIRGARKASASILEENNSSLNDNFRKRDFGARRAIKSIIDDDDETAGLGITRFRKSILLDDAIEAPSAASLRANATRERLANIESEMSERFEKQIQREKRSANLKKLLNESDIETTKVVKKVTF